MTPSNRKLADPDSAAEAQPRLILASASPRRASLLAEYGYDFEAITPTHEEPHALAELLPPAQKVQALSYFKAQSVATTVDRGLVLGGDTLAATGTIVYGKPIDRDDARATLSTLAGTTHQVITGVTLLDAATGRRLIQHETTSVTMRPITETEMDEYLDTGAWEGKAGAYGIQDHGDAFVERIDGSFTNVVGFPMELVGRMLVEWGVRPIASRQE